MGQADRDLVHSRSLAQGSFDGARAERAMQAADSCADAPVTRRRRRLLTPDLLWSFNRVWAHDETSLCFRSGQAAMLFRIVNRLETCPAVGRSARPEPERSWRISYRRSPQSSRRAAGRPRFYPCGGRAPRRGVDRRPDWPSLVRASMCGQMALPVSACGPARRAARRSSRRSSVTSFSLRARSFAFSFRSWYTCEHGAWPRRRMATSSLISASVRSSPRACLMNCRRSAVSRP